jgi:4-amino-4-deoxy-L-arabinose transferase-like glycosyltransferase
MPHDADITSARCAAPSIDRPAARLRPFTSPLSPRTWPSAAVAAAKLHATTIALVLCFLIPGLIGHDPWKQDEAYVFGMVIEILRGGDWVVPLLAGEPFMEKPPLYYLAAALTARVASPLLPPHDGARLASGFFIALALVFVGLTARRLFGPGRGTAAVLLLAGTVGLMQHAHEMLPDTALFCGFAMAIYGLAWARESVLKGGFLLGTGVGIGFLSKGLIEPVVIGMSALALPIFRNWRSSQYRAALVIAALVALPWLIVWPIALYWRSPDLFLEWFWTNNFGRYFGFAHLGADSRPWYYTGVLPWFTLPVGPLALWVFARKWRDLAGDPALQLGAALIVATLLVLTTSASARSLYALPLLLPLAIIASSLSGPAYELAVRWGARFGVLFFGGIALLLWSLWVYGFIHGHPPQFERLLAKLPADYDFSLAWPFLTGALALVGFWAFVLSRRNLSGIHRWTASVALAWGTAMTLLLPWLDYAKSFRGSFTELAARVHEGECVSSIGLGEPQRGMLDYVGGIRTYREETNARYCRHLLVQTNQAYEAPGVASDEWALAWQGGRPGELDERFTLFERRDVARLHIVRVR